MKKGERKLPVIPDPDPESDLIIFVITADQDQEEDHGQEKTLDRAIKSI